MGAAHAVWVAAAPPALWVPPRPEAAGWLSWPPLLPPPPPAAGVVASAPGEEPPPPPATTSGLVPEAPFHTALMPPPLPPVALDPLAAVKP